jgi:hypothetical protein
MRRYYIAACVPPWSDNKVLGDFVVRLKLLVVRLWLWQVQLFCCSFKLVFDIGTCWVGGNMLNCWISMEGDGLKYILGLFLSLWKSTFDLLIISTYYSMGRDNPITNFWPREYPTANFIFTFPHYLFLHQSNVSVSKVIRQQSPLVDELTLLTGYALYLTLIGARQLHLSYYHASR